MEKKSVQANQLKVGDSIWLLGPVCEAVSIEKGKYARTLDIGYKYPDGSDMEGHVFRDNVGLTRRFDIVVG